MDPPSQVQFPAPVRDVVVVVPCYNEAARLAPNRFAAYAEEHPDTSFLFVDDGSSDGTRVLLREWAGTHPGMLQAMVLPRNLGKSGAVREGVLEAIRRGAGLVGYWDADLSTPLAEIETFVDILRRDPSLLGVIGSRVQRLGSRVERDPLRHYAGRVFATVASIVLDLPVYDTQCGAKLFRVGPALSDAFAEPFLSRWIFDVELIGRLVAALPRATAAALIHEKPLAEWRDVPGSKLRLRHALGAVVEILRIRRQVGGRR